MSQSKILDPTKYISTKYPDTKNNHSQLYSFLNEMT